MAGVYLVIAGLILMSPNVASDEVKTCLPRPTTTTPTACHGYSLSCNVTEYILLQRMSYGVVTEKSCTPSPSSRKCYNEDGCCVMSSQYYCRMTYPRAAVYAMYSRCSANQHCQGLAPNTTDVQPVCEPEPPRSGGPPPGDLLPLDSFLEYQCVDATKFTNFCRNTKQTITAPSDRDFSIHVMHKHDSDVPDKSSPIACTCSVATETGSDVSVRYEDIRLYRHSPPDKCSSASFTHTMKRTCAGNDPVDGFTTSTAGIEQAAPTVTVSLDGVYKTDDGDTPEMVWISFTVGRGEKATVTCNIAIDTSGSDGEDDDNDRGGGDADRLTVVEEELSTVNVPAIVVPIVCVLLIIAVVVGVFIWRHRKRKRKTPLPTVEHLHKDSYREGADEVYSTINPEDVHASRNNSYYKVERHQPHTPTTQARHVDGYDKVTPEYTYAESGPNRKENTEAPGDGYNRLNFKQSHFITETNSHNSSEDNCDTQGSKANDTTACYNKLTRYNPDSQSNTRDDDDYDRTTTNTSSPQLVSADNDYNRMHPLDYNKIDFMKLSNTNADSNYSHLNNSGPGETSMDRQASHTEPTSSGADAYTDQGAQQLLNDDMTTGNSTQAQKHQRKDSYEDPFIAMKTENIRLRTDDYETPQVVEQGIPDSNDTNIPTTQEGKETSSDSDVNYPVVNSGDVILPTKYAVDSDDSDSSGSESMEDTDVHMKPTDHNDSTPISEEMTTTIVHRQHNDYETPQLDKVQFNGLKARTEEHTGTSSDSKL